MQVRGNGETNWMVIHNGATTLLNRLTIQQQENGMTPPTKVFSATSGAI